MFRVLGFVPAYEVPRWPAGGAAARRLLRGALLHVAEKAARLAGRLDAADVPAPQHAVVVAGARPQAPAAAGGVRLVEAAVVLAVAAYFVAGLAAVFVA